MPVAMIMTLLYTQMAVYTMATIMSLTYSIAMAARQASQAKQAQADAVKNYYAELQKGKVQTKAFESSKGSFKDVRMQAQKYSLISVQMQKEAAARESFRGTRQDPGFKPRTDKQRLQDFNLSYSAKSISMETEDKVLEMQDLFKPYNFGVENFNINYFGEA